MSDFEDDMDVDVPVNNGDITFAASNTDAKGKRSAANLPVEAEDTLPWFVMSVQAIEIKQSSFVLGLKNTDHTLSMMCLDIKISWPR